MVYVPPSTNIEAMETPVDDANLRARVGEGRPGSVVRNLIWKTFQAERKGQAPKRYSQPFSLLRDQIEEWFGVTVNDPEYIEGRSRYVVSTYTVRQKVELDWVNAGSGLLQSLIILSFLYGFQPDVLLLDEPDAHLHVNLQRAMLDFLNRQTQTQMLIATHAEEFIKRVRPEQISFLTTDGVRRVPDTEQARLVLSEISNLDLLNLLARKLIIYVEGETDEECIRGWARAMVSAPGFEGLPQAMESATFIPLGGGNAEEMLDRARRHFRACRFLDPSACRLMVMDRNDGKWQPRLGRDSTLVVWSRRHVESYLLVPAAWERAATSAAERQFTLARDRALAETQGFFREQSGGLDIDWMNPAVEAFRDPNAKLMLFEARVSRGDTYNALAARLYDAGVRIQRRDVAMAMPPDEIHADVKAVLTRIVAETARKPGLEIRETADDDWDISGGALPQRQRPVPDAHDG
jgi:hypothetical protein